MPLYVVDTNFFIQAHRSYYPLDVASSFWSKVKELADTGKIISIDKVKNEIYKNDDELKRWCLANLPQDFFKDTTIVLAEYSQVVIWAASKSSHYSSTAIAEFLDADEADAWLVSFALNGLQNRIIVTYEKSQPEIKRKIKIPEVCNQFTVSYVDTIEMFRQLGERF
jgi:hypothetical protein